MNKRKLIYFLCAFVLIIGCYALNLSYSLFTQNITPEDNFVDSSVLVINASLETSTFTIPSNGSKVITLKINNTGNANIQYGISIPTLEEGIKAYLVDKTDNEIVGNLEQNTNKEILVYVENENSEEKTITFNLESKYETINFDKETFIKNSNIDCVNKVKLLNETILVNSKSGIEGRSVFTEPSDLPTIPAEKINEPDEKILSYTEDNYTTITNKPSYYYRGNVEDNYVTFADMCWRIVRIDGNGNTKLILEDQDEVCSTTMNGNWDIEASDGTNITMNGTNPYRTGNFGYDDSTDKYKMSYLNPVDNPNRAMVNAFKYFQTNTLTNKITSTYTGKTISDFLVSGNWCLNNKAYSDSAGTTLLENPDYSSEFYYDSYVRLYGKTKKEPSLKCPVETMETFGDNTTPMYVGTLTADEIVYAGGKMFIGNSNYYLINNWQATYSKFFWSLSPSNFLGKFDFAFYVRDDGLLNNGYVRDIYYEFRPVINLRSDILIESGDGTKEVTYDEEGNVLTGPYVIK